MRAIVDTWARYKTPKKGEALPPLFFKKKHPWEFHRGSRTASEMSSQAGRSTCRDNFLALSASSSSLAIGFSVHQTSHCTYVAKPRLLTASRHC